MIIHCSRKLAAKLPAVSTTPLAETSLLGSWHGHLFIVDRRQCVMFCHDASRYCLFLSGLRKPQFAELGDRWFRLLYLASLAALGCSDARVARAGLALGPICFDTVTDRSVQGSLNIARRDLDAAIVRVANVMELDPVAVACRLNHRPATVYGKLVWPDRTMLEAVAGLA